MAASYIDIHSEGDTRAASLAISSTGITSILNSSRMTEQDKQDQLNK